MDTTTLAPMIVIALLTLAGIVYIVAWSAGRKKGYRAGYKDAHAEVLAGNIDHAAK